MRTLNVKLVVWLGIVSLVLVVGVWLIHGYQVRRNAHLLRTLAEQAREDGNLEEAIRHLYRYLAYYPEDMEAYSRFALNIADVAADPNSNRDEMLRAYQVMEQVLRKDASQREVRRRLADFAIGARGLGRPDIAAQQYEILLKGAKKDEDTYDIRLRLGACYQAKDEIDKCRTIYEQLVAEYPERIRAYMYLAQLLLVRFDSPDEATAIIDKMVEQNPDSGEAYLARARFRSDNQKKQEAVEDLGKALELAPEDINVLEFAATFASQGQNYKSARKFIERCHEIRPEDSRYKTVLARLDWMEGQRTEAIDGLKELLKAEPLNYDVLKSLAEFQVQTRDTAGARESLAQIRKIPKLAPEQADLVEARILFAEDKIAESARLLSRIRPLLLHDKQTAVGIDLMLASCYNRLGQVDQQLRSYESAKMIDPFSLPARRGLASTLTQLGRTDEALVEWEQLLEFDPFAASMVVPMRIKQVLSQPEGQRNWQPVEELIARLEAQQTSGPLKPTNQDEAKPDDIVPVLTPEVPGESDSPAAAPENQPPKTAPSTTMFRVELLLAQKKVEEAKKLVEEFRQANPQSHLPYVYLAAIAREEGKEQEALGIINEGLQAIPGNSMLEMARIEHLARMTGDAGKEEIDKQMAAVDTLPAEQQVSALKRFAAAYFRLGEKAKSEELWLRLQTMAPEDDQVLLTLFGLAQDRSDDAGMEERLEAIKNALGEQSATYNFARAAQLITQFRLKKADKDTLKEAQECLDAASEQRPSWHSIYSLGSEIDIANGDYNSAIRKLQQAYTFGERGPVYLSQLAKLLVATRRFAEARDMLQTIAAESGGKLPAELQRLEIVVNQGQGDVKEALEQAESILGSSESAPELTWYGQLLASNDRFDDSIPVFRKALSIDGTSAETWLSLVQSLNRSGKTSEAETAIEEMSTKIPQDVAGIAVAQGYELIGKGEKADKQYAAVAAAKPDDLTTGRVVANYFLRTNRLTEAATYLKKMIDTTDPKLATDRNVHWARRRMAQLLSIAGTQRAFQEALELLEANKVDGQLGLEELVLKATLLGNRLDKQSRNEAIDILESARQQTRLTPEIQLALAELYNRNDLWTKCRGEMLELLANAPDNQKYVDSYIRMLLQHDELGEAETHIEQFEQSGKDPVRALEFRARLLAKQHRTEEAVPLLLAAIPSPIPPQQLNLVRSIVVLLLELARTAPPELAQKIYGETDRLAAQYIKEAPDETLPLAVYYGERNKLNEALDLCEQSLKTRQLAEVVQTALTLLRDYGTGATPADYQRVGVWVQQLVKEMPDPINGELVQAEFLDVQGNLDEASKLYRKVLTYDKLSEVQRVAALNNLAFMLATKLKKGKEALPMIQSAIEITGPIPELLDTRGMAYLASGEPKKAIVDLEESILADPDSVKYFHLALAHQKANEQDLASRALEKARENGFTDSRLKPDDLKLYQDLVKSIN